jgi:hypothetical protein
MSAFRLISNRIEMGKILALRSSQYVQPLYVEDIVTPGAVKTTPLPLSTIGAFQVLSFTGFYTSLMVKDAVALTLKDVGVCPLRMKINAGASSLEMFGDYVPMNLLFVPGRQRVNPADPQLITGGYTLADADQGPVPNQMAANSYPYIFPFQANDTITISVKNDFDSSASGWSNRWGICFLGIRVRDIPQALRETNTSSTKK